MYGYILLMIAITGEVFATTMMKASEGYKKRLPIILMGVGYIISFSFLSLTLKSIPLGTAYAIWAGLGTAFTAVIGIMVYKEKVTKKKAMAIAMIVIGVIMINLGSGE